MKLLITDDKTTKSDLPIWKRILNNFIDCCGSKIYKYIILIITFKCFLIINGTHSFPIGISHEMFEVKSFTKISTNLQSP